MKYDEVFIQDLINTCAEETITLEFKAALALNNQKEIAKDVSAMANSAGGLIIYGIIEDDQKASYIDFIDGNKYTKETLEQIINSRIQKKIPKLKVIPIRFNDEISKSIYVVNIPESDEAPHMAENKYYRRYNFQSISMDEYEVRNLYFRSHKPKLEFAKSIFEYDKDSDRPKKNERGKYGMIQGNIFLYLKNVGKIVCPHYKVEISINENLIQKKHTDPHHEIYKYPSYINGDNRVFSVSSDIPIYQGEKKARLISIPVYFGGTAIEEYLNSKIGLRLFHDGGIITRSIKLTDLIKVDNKPLERDEFQYYKRYEFKSEDFSKDSK